MADAAAAGAMAPAELAASGAGVDAITSALAAPAEDVEVDAAEENKMGLREAETDRVLDKSSSNDALHSVTVATFNDPKLALPENLLKALYEMKFVRPSKIQAAALPKIWAGRNLLAQSHNGTGKTACFVLGMLKVASEEKVPQALCLTPTRELAKQIEDEIRKMGKYLIESGSVAVKCILREERYEKGFKMEQQIICGTAGKVWTLIQMRVIETSKIRVFVLDEADEMLAIGGQGDQSKRIKQKLNRDVQVLFFSATWTEEVIKFAKQIGGAAENWSQIEVQREHIFNDQTKQMFYRSKGLKEKEGHLKDLLNVVTVGQCIIFVNTRDAVDKLGAMLIADGHQVSSLHGKMDSSARDKVLLDFRSGTTKFLITTNILSRGIDVPAVTLVIQYDMPIKPGGTADPDTYLHRVGRTGRFGKKGFALNLVHDDREMQTLKRIETYFQRENFIQEVPPDSDADDFAKLLHIEV
jgi:ATP-dependent RNA helicase DDX19/DBP5